jgi:hypothetical protein
MNRRIGFKYSDMSDLRDFLNEIWPSLNSKLLYYFTAVFPRDNILLIQATGKPNNEYHR